MVMVAAALVNSRVPASLERTGNSKRVLHKNQQQQQSLDIIPEGGKKTKWKWGSHGVGRVLGARKVHGKQSKVSKVSRSPGFNRSVWQMRKLGL